MKADKQVCTRQGAMFMTPPLHFDYIPLLIMKRIEFENICNVFRPIT
jgi:hypothetical protein